MNESTQAILAFALAIAFLVVYYVRMMRRAERQPPSPIAPSAPLSRDDFERWLKGIVAAIGEGRYYNARVAGVSYANDDGSSRQSIVAKLMPRDVLVLEPEPTNAYDKYAVAVKTRDGHQIGYLDRRNARETSRRMQAGELWTAVIRNVDGSNGSHLGVSIVMIQVKPEALNAEA